MRLFSFAFQAQDFRARIERARPRLYRLAFSWCHDAALADDLVQDTLYKALKSAGQLRDMAVLEGWLFKILANGWRDHFRRQRNIQDIDDMDELPFTDGFGPEDLRGQSELAARVRKAVASLPLGQRQVLTLVDLEDASYSEAADILNIPVGTVMSRLCRARAALKIQLIDMRNDATLKTKIRSVP